MEETPIPFGPEGLKGRVVVVGSGPAGMFAALELARAGYRPLLLERGKPVPERDGDISTFFKGGELNTESNVQFGEGGAGTYSDGKLTTRIKDGRCQRVFGTLVKKGAPEEILYSHKPHIGTDVLKSVVVNLRNEIISLGGEVCFGAKMTDLILSHEKVVGILLEDGRRFETGAMILAIGHSSRDTYEMLYRRGVAMEQKAFAIGLRVEHRQSMLNEGQYGRYADHKKLGAADYSLAMRSSRTGRSAYSFCMCPGGYVVAATSEKDQVVVNGMSEFRRDGDNANSALVVNVNPQDFGEHLLDGIEFQRHWERMAFRQGGGNYHAPVEGIGSFLGGGGLGGASVLTRPTYVPGVKNARLEECIPRYVALTLQEGILDFGRKIRGFSDGSGILTGVETRTSAPVRIVRKKDCQSVNVGNLYPCGEGAGYAGGIVSAAVDGIRCAQAIMERFKPF